MKARLLIIFAISLSFIIITLTLLSNTLGLIVQADTFTVTIFSDTNDGNCDADCSLREAVMAANNNPGPDTITLAAGTYVLTLGGDLDVTDALTITGVGPDRTVIDANGTSRIFNLTSEATSVTLSNMTLTGGVTSQPGGGISHSGNRLILSNTVVISNKVTSDFVAGGGIAVLGGASITLIGGQVVSNTTGGDGGGIYLGSGASLTQTGETIIGYNYAKHRAGGIWLGFSTKTVLDGAQIINNRSDASSGGIFIGDDSSLTMNGGKISENSAYFVGGG
jgi:fibronectin-binding autotransporter adhesin